MHNQDAKSYNYQITCASKAETGQINASEKKKLKGKSGCHLKLESGKAVKLFTEMVCVIKEGKLSCSLI